MSNEEKQDLLEPLPAEWTKESLTDVTLYQQRISPPCTKMRYILGYYQVPFKTVSGSKPDSEYKKIPVLDVNGRQINDSYIMVKSLAPILDQPLTKEQVELEELVTFGLMIAMEKKLAGNCCSLCKCACKVCCCPGFMLGCCAPILCCFGPSKVGADQPDLKTVSEYSVQIAKFLEGKQFFSGREEPGINDLSLYGMLGGFVAVGDSSVNDFLGGKDDPLRLWHTRMKQKLTSEYF